MIFVGIVTCNRPDFFKKSYESIRNAKNVNLIAVVNDGKEIVDPEETTIYIPNEKNLGVGKSKNILLKKALEYDMDHIFIVEDDIVVKNPEVFNEYVKARNLTGLQHFCYGYHGPANKNGISGGKASPRYVVDYGSIKIAINMHSVGAFCYYSKEVLKEVGLLDEKFTNAFEHVDHSYRIAKAGYTTPYWNWPDLQNSMDYLEEIECSEKSSAIRPRDDWRKNIEDGVKHFQKKHGFLPAWNGCVPDTKEEDVKKIMKDIFKKSAQKNP